MLNRLPDIVNFHNKLPVNNSRQRTMKSKVKAYSVALYNLLHELSDGKYYIILLIILL